MAVPHDGRIGRTRLRLASMITAEFPELHAPYATPQGYIVDPSALRSQTPIYASPKFDCCSWDADFAGTSGYVHMYSWDTMSELVRRGFDYTREGHEIELSCK